MGWPMRFYNIILIEKCYSLRIHLIEVGLQEILPCILHASPWSLTISIRSTRDFRLIEHLQIMGGESNWGTFGLRTSFSGNFRINNGSSLYPRNILSLKPFAYGHSWLHGHLRWRSRRRISVLVNKHLISNAFHKCLIDRVILLRANLGIITRVEVSNGYATWLKLLLMSGDLRI